MMLLDCVVKPIQGPPLDDGRRQYERQADLGGRRTARFFHETTPISLIWSKQYQGQLWQTRGSWLPKWRTIKEDRESLGQVEGLELERVSLIAHATAAVVFLH